MAGRVTSDLATGSAHNALAATQLWMGEFTAARENSEKAIEIFGHDVGRYLPMMNAPVIPSHCNIVWALHIGGHIDEAKRRIAEAEDPGVAAAPALQHRVRAYAHDRAESFPAGVRGRANPVGTSDRTVD